MLQDLNQNIFDLTYNKCYIKYNFLNYILNYLKIIFKNYI
jgi:hypothetical protein